MTNFFKSGWFFITLFLLLILAAYISGRITLRNMRNEGKEADIIFCTIVDGYQSLDTLLLQMIPENSRIHGAIPRPIQMIWPELDCNQDISFHIFNEFHTRMVEYDLYLDQLLVTGSYDPVLKTFTDTLRSEQAHLRELKTRYNMETLEYNTFIKQFPRNFYSSFFHFQAKRPFELNSFYQNQD